MKLSTSLFIHELQNKNIPIKHNVMIDDEIVSTIRILDTNSFHRHILYISPLENVQDIPTPSPIMFVAGIPSSGFQDNIVYVDLCFITLFNVLQSIFDHYQSIESRLVSAVSTNKSLKEILNISSDFFCNPVHILDGSMHYIEYSDNMIRKNHTDAATGNELTEISKNFTDEVIMNLLREKGLLFKLTHSKSPVLIRLPELSVAFISVNFFENETRTSVLSVLETITTLHPSQSILAEQVAKIIEPAIEKYGDHPELSSEFKQIVIDLLESRRVDVEKFNFYLKKMGWNLNDRYHIFKIKIPQEVFKNGTSEYTLGLIKRYFPNNILLKMDPLMYVMIINANSKGFDFKGSIKKIEQHLKKEGVTISISRYFENLIKLSEHYRTVNDLLILGDKLAPGKNIHYYPDFAIAHMLFICSHEIDIEVFCLPEALILYDYDQKNDTDFFNSLYTYLKNNKSLALASKILHIHRNTLVYRIEKAVKLTDLDLNDSELIMNILISYKALYYKDLLSDFRMY